uniref:Predicted protein n=1 Tax=Physcomitrium patens TaxID=3218 RepID=A9TZN1_PHYPA
MRALVQDYLKEHETIARESASYGTRVDDDLSGSIETSEFWSSAISIMQEGKLPRDTLLRIVATIRGATGWEDPVESLLVHAYIAKSQHKALIIKRKRQLMGEIGMSHAIDARIYKDEEEVDIGYKQPTNEKNGVTIEVLVKVGDIQEPIVALVDHGSKINLMSKELYKKQKWSIDMEHGWVIQAANNTWGELYGACPDVKIRIGDVAMEQYFYVQDTTSYPLILGQPYVTATWMETKVLDDGSTYARRDYGGTKEEVLSRDEGAFDASFIDILENGNIMYKKVNDFKRKERKRLYDIEGQLRKLGILQDDERILGVYEKNGLEDSLELITSIGLGDNDKILEIHSRQVYTILESFQGPEVTVETRYKTTDKKVKPVVGPLLEDSKDKCEKHQKKKV